MLVLPRQVHHLRHLGLRDFVGEHAAHADAAPMDVQHDPGGLLARLLEETLQDMHDELHRGVVVVEHQHLVHGGLAGLGPRLDDDAGIRVVAAIPPVVAPSVVAAIRGRHGDRQPAPRSPAIACAVVAHRS